MTATGARTAYTEYAPSPELGRATAQAIRCTWSRYVEGAREQHSVLPDGCVDLVVLPDGQVSIAGPDTGPVMAELTTGWVVGLRFEVGAAGAALGLSASELRDQRVPLVEVWGASFERVAERLVPASSPEALRAALERAVRDRTRGAPVGDPLVMEAVRRLESGDTPVSALASDLGVSERHLLRRFDVAVGYGPKTLERVLRFRRLLEALRADREPGLAPIAAATGYADQAHMSRECRRLAGVTPKALYARSRP